MEPSCVPHNLIPGTSKLFVDFLYHFDRVSAFYPYNFLDPQSFKDAAAQINYPEDRRQRLVAALREQNGDSPALEQLARPGTTAIVTGQQVGFLSGPSYTIYKALTAVRLAQELRRQDIDAVPIFWLASEDHDLAEVDHAWIFDPSGKPVRVSTGEVVSTGGPVGEVKLPDAPLQGLRKLLGDLPFADEVFERLSRAYLPGATFSQSFKAFLADVLSGFGILFLDPLAPAMRSIARPFLAEAVTRVPELLEELRDRDRQLAEHGYHSQVHLDEGSSLLFLLNGKRTPLRWKDGQFNVRDKTLSPSELQASAERLSPNALLRPVMQDYLLPTLAYVGGPSEIAYMAQSQVLYQKLLGRMPVIFPRNTFTLLDSRADKLIARYGLSFPELLEPHEKVKSRIAARLVPPALREQLSALETTIGGELDKLRQSLRAFDPTLETASQKSGDKMLYQLHRLSEKTARETLRREERSNRESDYLIDLVYPERRLQERLYSIAPLLAKHGLDLPQRIFEMTQVTCPDHMVRTV